MNLKENTTISYLTYLYGSKEGIIQRINEYLYQLVVIEKEEIRIVLEEILKSEMNHLKVIGKQIRELGYYPIFATITSNTEKYWNAYELYYDQEISSILEIDITQKKKALFHYQLFMDYTKNSSLKRLIEQIIEEEYEHLEKLYSLYKNGCSTCENS